MFSPNIKEALVSFLKGRVLRNSRKKRLEKVENVFPKEYLAMFCSGMQIDLGNQSFNLTSFAGLAAIILKDCHEALQDERMKKLASSSMSSGVHLTPLILLVQETKAAKGH